VSTLGRRLSFTVYGTPAPQGSKRHVGNGVMIEMSKRVKPWRADVREAALSALDHAEWDRGARVLGVAITFTMPRPRFHFRTGRFAHELRPDAPVLVGVKPDLDKLVRSTLDALASAGAYADDARVAQLYVRKLYPKAHSRQVLDRPGALIDLWDLSPQPAPVHTTTTKEKA
jgi:crossover junction endodeoxyribonuclease RusA